MFNYNFLLNSNKKQPSPVESVDDLPVDDLFPIVQSDSFQYNIDAGLQYTSTIIGLESTNDCKQLVKTIPLLGVERPKKRLLERGLDIIDKKLKRQYISDWKSYQKSTVASIYTVDEIMSDGNPDNINNGTSVPNPENNAELLLAIAEQEAEINKSKLPKPSPVQPRNPIHGLEFLERRGRESSGESSSSDEDTEPTNDNILDENKTLKKEVKALQLEVQSLKQSILPLATLPTLMKSLLNEMNDLKIELNNINVTTSRIDNYLKFTGKPPRKEIYESSEGEMDVEGDEDRSDDQRDETLHQAQIYYNEILKDIFQHITLDVYLDLTKHSFNKTYIDKKFPGNTLSLEFLEKLKKKGGVAGWAKLDNEVGRLMSMHHKSEYLPGPGSSRSILSSSKTKPSRRSSKASVTSTKSPKGPWSYLE